MCFEWIGIMCGICNLDDLMLRQIMCGCYYVTTFAVCSYWSNLFVFKSQFAVFSNLNGANDESIVLNVAWNAVAFQSALFAQSLLPKWCLVLVKSRYISAYLLLSSCSCGAPKDLFFNDLHAMVIVYVKCPLVGVNDAHGHASLIYLPLSHCTGYRWLVTV